MTTDNVDRSFVERRFQQLVADKSLEDDVTLAAKMITAAIGDAAGKVGTLDLFTGVVLSLQALDAVFSDTLPNEHLRAMWMEAHERVKAMYIVIEKEQHDE